MAASELGTGGGRSALRMSRNKLSGFKLSGIFNFAPSSPTPGSAVAAGGTSDADPAARRSAGKSRTRLLETGNVVLQACLGSLANMLQRRLEISTPSLVEGGAVDLMQRVSSEGVVFIYVNFVLRGRQVRGYIALLMDLAAFTALKRLVGDFIRRETDE